VYYSDGGVERCQGRPVGTFILTLDSAPRHFMIEPGTKRNAVQLSFVPYWMGSGLAFLKKSHAASHGSAKMISPFPYRFYSR
jgi:hypothetical protein